MYDTGVIEQRTATLYQIQQRSKDRKFLICVFALTGHQANVIFIDCWRRWRKWITMRMGWRLAARQCRYEWSVIKISTLFKAWRALTSYRDPEVVETAMQRTDSTAKSRQSMLKKQASAAVKLAKANKDAINDGEDHSPEGSVSDNDYDDENIIYEDENIGDGEDDDAEAEYSDMSDDDEVGNMEAINKSTAGFLKNIAMKNSAETLNNQSLGNGGVTDTSNIMKGRRKNRKGLYPYNYQSYVLALSCVHKY